jgi:rubrerythrin
LQKTRHPINPDTDFYRCQRCGFPLDLSREKSRDGDGIELVSTTAFGYSVTDPVPKTGACPFCGTFNFKK